MCVGFVVSKSTNYALGPLQYHGLMLIAAWTSNQMPSKVCTTVSENGYLISLTYYNRCNSFSILGIQLIHMRKMVLWCFWSVVHEYAIMSLGSYKRSVMYSGEMNFIWPEKWQYLSIHVTKLVDDLQYIPKNMHTVFALLCFVVVIHWLIFPYPSGLLHWHWGNLTIAPVPAKQSWWIWINTSCEFIMNDCITTTKQSTIKPCAYFLGYTVLKYPYISIPKTHKGILTQQFRQLIAHLPMVWRGHVPL